jgi:hypothetical protein
VVRSYLFFYQVVRFLARTIGFFLLSGREKVTLRPTQVSTYKEAFSCWVKWQVCQTEDSLPSVAEIKNDWNYTSSSRIHFLAATGKFCL